MDVAGLHVRLELRERQVPALAAEAADRHDRDSTRWRARARRRSASPTSRPPSGIPTRPTSARRRARCWRCRPRRPRPCSPPAGSRRRPANHPGVPSPPGRAGEATARAPDAAARRAAARTARARRRDGPADGTEPVCAVADRLRRVRHRPRETRDERDHRRAALRRRITRAGISRPTAATPPATAITGASHGSHDGVRPSSTIDQTAVATTPSASSARAANAPAGARRRPRRSRPAPRSRARAPPCSRCG